tara:strand:- start:26 stop:994 length:969 start_codon:yes stop_codon:yes gene_type:complete
MSKILISGVKPTGRPHIGNYLGAMRQFVDLQEEFEARVFVADLHALTTVQDRDQLSKASIDVAMDYLAIGLDPEKTLIYKQSDVPEVTELTWVFNCLTTMPYLMRAHAFKDAEAKNKDINVGVFDYPILMAADILIHDADVVPVGLDQKQHLEIARDTAEKFNRIFGETFKLPEPRIQKETETIPGTDGQKMSKSYGNTIPLFATDEEIKKAVMSVATDSKSPEEPKDIEGDTLFTLHTFFTKGDDLEKVKEGYEKGGLSYKESKNILIKHITDLVKPLREKRFEIAKDTDSVRDMLSENGKKVKELISSKMEVVRRNIGLY